MREENKPYNRKILYSIFKNLCADIPSSDWFNYNMGSI